MVTKNSNDFIVYSPEEEFISHVQQKIDSATRFDEHDKLELHREALELGLQILRSVS